MKCILKEIKCLNPVFENTCIKLVLLVCVAASPVDSVHISAPIDMIFILSMMCEERRALHRFNDKDTVLYSQFYSTCPSEGT